MKKFPVMLFVSIILSAILSSSTLFAESTGNDFASLLNTVHSMQADFSQVVYDNRGKTIQKSSGRMAFDRPGKFRWQTNKPSPQLIVANGSRLWIYDPDLQQVTVRSLSHAAGETPALLLSHVDNDISRSFVIKEKQGRANARWFTLTPKQKDSMFESIQMGFVNGRIQQMRLQDHLGHATSIQFGNAKVNIPLASNLFVFKPSSKVDVINETQQKKK